MLPMGWIAHVGSGPRFSRLTVQEQRSMLNMWVMSRAPLIWGGDPALSNRSTYALLENQQALDVQHRSCRNKQLQTESANTSIVWVAQGVSHGSRFAAFFNLADKPAVIEMPWAAVHLPANSTTKELWGRESLVSSDSTGIRATLAPHDSVLLALDRPTEVIGECRPARGMPCGLPHWTPTVHSAPACFRNGGPHDIAGALFHPKTNTWHLMAGCWSDGGWQHLTSMDLIRWKSVGKPRGFGGHGWSCAR
jgi:hypothetical protein